MARRVHLMNDDLLNACGRAVMNELHVAPFSTPEKITCPHCRPLIDGQRRAQVDRDGRASPGDRTENMSDRISTDDELRARFAHLGPRMAQSIVDARNGLQRELDHAEALAENEAHDLAMEKATEPTVEQLVQFATQRASTMPQTLRNRINSARTLLVVPPGRMQA